MSAVLAIDIGTTRTKAAVYDDGLSRLAFSSCATDGIGEDGTVDVERSVRAALDAAAEAIAAADVGRVVAVAVTSILCTVFCDGEGNPVGPGLAWNWVEAAAEARELAAAVPGLERPMTAELLAPRLAWIARNEPAILRRTRSVRGLKDVVISALGAKPPADYSHRDYSGVVDRRGRLIEGVDRWLSPVVEPFLAVGGGAASLVGSAVPPHRVVGLVSEGAAARIGVPAGTPIVAGSTDGTAAMYGAGVLSAGTVAAVFGTTDVLMVRAAGDARPEGSREGAGLSTNASAVDGVDLVGASTGASGSAALWCRRRFGVEADEWPAVRPGADGVRCAPGFAGERAPFNRPSSRGAFHGVTLAHTGAHLTRALLEAQCFRVRRILEELAETAGASGVAESTGQAGGGGARKAGGQVRKAGGGGAKVVFGGGNTSPALDGLRASILPAAILRRREAELSLCGAAMYALSAHRAEVNRTEADLRLEALGRHAADDSEAVSPDAEGEYDRLYETWSRWIDDYYSYGET